MRKILAFVCLVVLTIGCVKREPLVLATVLGTDQRMCATCGGWFIQVDTIRYRTQTLPPPFREENTPVYIRFRRSGKANYMSDLIELLDIRAR